MFNGQKIISVSTDATTATFADVKALFSGKGVTFHHFTNDNTLGEVVSFETMLKSVENIDPRQITLYCHAKGVKYAEEEMRKLKVHSWTELMYSTLLDYPSLIEDALKQKSITGSFLKRGNTFGNLPPAWHFAGTFFWFRNNAVFSQPNWNYIPKMWWGTEAWPAILFPDEKDVECIFLEGKVPEMQLYFQKYWTNTVNAAWHRFQVENASLKRHYQYQEVIDTLRVLGCRKILVTGPQRSGTMLASTALSKDLKLPHIVEETFDTHDFQKFNDLVKTKPEFVMQCPTMSSYVHLMPDVMVVWMQRNITDILRSRNRINWNIYEQIEKDRYFHHGSTDSAHLKGEAWMRFQRITLGERAIDLDYESMHNHPLWIDKEHRANFTDKQVYPCK